MACCQMTIEEKVWQLDMYSSAKEIIDKHTDDTHADPSALFLPEKAQVLWAVWG